MSYFILFIFYTGVMIGCTPALRPIVPVLSCVTVVVGSIDCTCSCSGLECDCNCNIKTKIIITLL